MEKEATEDSAAMMEYNEEPDEDDAEEEKDKVQENVKETKKKARGKKGSRTVLSGRGVTLKMLVDDGILNVEEGCMSIDYLGQKFVADLLSNGKIKWEGSNKLFNSPSAWAIHCKKLVNPSKKSGCGWASVKYKGKKLDQFKTTWFRQQRPLFHSNKSASPNTPSVKKPATSSPALSFPASKTKTETTSTVSSATSQSAGQAPPLSSPGASQGKQDKSTTYSAASFTKNQSTSKKESQKLKNKAQRQSRKERLQESQRKSNVTAPPSKASNKQEAQSSSQSDLADLSSFTSSRKTKLVSWPRTSVNVSEVRQDSNPQTLVECLNFANLKKTQPFTVSINTNTLMLMDLHCHLTTSEVVGYLGGHWNRDTQYVQVVQAFPVKCRFANQKNAETVEEEIRLAMKARGLVVVGWYHSHPTYQADPSVRDIAAQQHYQKCLKMEKSTYEPCLGFIVSPYDPHLSSRESVVKAFWVQSDSGRNTLTPGYPLPMAMNFSIHQSGLLTDDLLTEMRQVCSYYKGSPDAVDFTESWLAGVTFLDKIKASLMRKFPKDQSNRLLCFINTLLV